MSVGLTIQWPKSANHLPTDIVQPDWNEQYWWIEVVPKAWFFPPILWCNHIGNCPEEDLAKFANKQDMKVEFF